MGSLRHREGRIDVSLSPFSDFDELQEELVRHSSTRSLANRKIFIHSAVSSVTDWANCSKAKREQLVSFLQALLHVERQPEFLIFSDSFPLEAFYAVLSNGKASDINLDYAFCVCPDIQEHGEEIMALRTRAAMNSGLKKLSISWECEFRRLAGGEMFNDPQMLVEWFLPACPELEHFSMEQDKDTCERDWDLVNPLSCKQKWWAILMSLPKLKVLNLEIQEDRLFEYFWEALAEAPLSPPKVKMSLHVVSQSKCDVVAQYLRQPRRHNLLTKPAQELEIRMGCFKDPDDQEGNGQLDQGHEKSVAMLSTLAHALEVNSSLVSFSLLEDETDIYRHKVVEAGAKHFEQALLSNTRLTSLSLSYADPVASQATATNIQMLLKLNNAGRSHLMEYPSNKSVWVHSIWKFRDDVSCVFFLLQSNPALCDIPHKEGDNHDVEMEALEGLWGSDDDEDEG